MSEPSNFQELYFWLEGADIARRFPVQPPAEDLWQFRKRASAELWLIEYDCRTAQPIATADRGSR